MTDALRLFLTVVVISLSCPVDALAIKADGAENNHRQQIPDHGSNDQGWQFHDLTPVEQIKVDQAYANALTHFYDGRFKEALSIFNALRPMVNHVEIAYLTAMCRYQLGHLSQAQNGFVKILSEDRNHHPARIALADLYAGNGDYSAAKKHIRYLDDEQLEEAHQMSLERLKSRIHPLQDKTFLHLFVDQGVRWNSNVNAGPDKKVITSPNGTVFRLDDNELAIGDWGSTTYLYGIFRFDPKSSDSLFFDTKASFYHSHYFEHDEFDYSSLRIQTGPVWKHKVYSMGLPAGYRASLDKGGLYSQELFIHPCVKLFLNKRLAIKGAFYYGDRAYEDKSDTDLDKLNRRLEISPILYLNKTLLSLRVSKLHASANNTRYSFHGTEAALYANHKFTNRLRMSLSYRHRIKQYEDRHPGWFDHRRDTKNSAHVSLTRKLNNFLYLGASLSWLRNDSNTELYEYERYTAGLNLTLKF